MSFCVSAVSLTDAWGGVMSTTLTLVQGSRGLTNKSSVSLASPHHIPHSTAQKKAPRESARHDVRAHTRKRHRRERPHAAQASTLTTTSKIYRVFFSEIAVHVGYAHETLCWHRKEAIEPRAPTMAATVTKFQLGLSLCLLLLGRWLGSLPLRQVLLCSGL